MNINGWWPRLDSSTRNWLMAHNGEPLPPPVLEQLKAAGAGDEVERGSQDEDGFHFADDVVDRIEAAANGEDLT